MPFLFTYGTLQDTQVQKYVFGRTLVGNLDELPEYKWIKKAVYDRYPLVKPTGNKNDSVKGWVYEISNTELQTCDVYETSAYRRQLLTLTSGKKAWVYVENSI